MYEEKVRKFNFLKGLSFQDILRDNKPLFET